MTNRSYVSSTEFRADCKKRNFTMQDEGHGLILAFAGEEYMDSFDGKAGFLLEETMVRPLDQMKYRQ